MSDLPHIPDEVVNPPYEPPETPMTYGTVGTPPEPPPEEIPPGTREIEEPAEVETEEVEEPEEEEPAPEPEAVHRSGPGRPRGSGFGRR
jgi:hypothetical protein